MTRRRTASRPDGSAAGSSHLPSFSAFLPFDKKPYQTIGRLNETRSHRIPRVVSSSRCPFTRPSPRFLGDIESEYDNERVFLGEGEGHKRINLLSQEGVQWGGWDQASHLPN